MASRYYTIECKLEKWTYITQYRTLSDAMNYIKRMKSHKYPYRITRVVKTKIFEEVA